jgi:mannose/cellobiose epimerase-like protein (N-acyl-D-glucosamine 2-epimerase family)
MTFSNLPADSWLNTPVHHAWLEVEAQRLLHFARAAQMPGGFGALDRYGKLPDDSRADTLHTARMVHCFAIAHRRGVEGAAALVDHGVAALRGSLRDAAFGGWFGCPDAADGDTDKPAYRHAFVALAASSAYVAGRPGAKALLDDSVGILERHFWQEDEGALCESFSQDWQQSEAYRGGNSNMHGTEAFLALADALQAPLWLDRALRISERIIHHHARANHDMPVEHFDAQWQPLLDYNQDKPDDLFRPFGQTPGHAYEWARLLLHLEAARQAAGLSTPDWLLDDARRLFAAATRHGWDVDGAPGIVYTLDWQQRPVVADRLHWTLAEAVAAAGALLQRTGEFDYEQWYRCFWDYIDTWLIDRQHGSWHHQLGVDNQPSHTIWPGKPDLYHAYQATLLPLVPLHPSLASSIKPSP